jgi:Fe-S-cluster containining protein
MAGFKCSACGLCCKDLKNMLSLQLTLDEPYRSLIAEFPYDYKEDGSCAMLENDKCKCYADRPLLCRVEDIWKTYFNHKSKKAYFKETHTMCNKLILSAGLNEKFLIKID